MKIRTKFTLIQVIILSGFLVAIGLILFRFNQADKLKNLELRGVQAITELKTLERKTDLFGSRRMPLNLLLGDWKETYRRFDYYYTVMLTDNAHRLLGKGAIIRSNTRLEAWQEIKKLEIEPLVENVERTISSNLVELTGSSGIQLSRLFIGENLGIDSQEVQALDEIDTRFRNLKDSLVASIFIPAENFIEDLRLRVETYSDTLYISTLILAVIIQTGSALAGMRFSRAFSRHMIELERTLTKVAEGNFDINLDIHSGDEFEDLANHFNILTQDLWNRLESMKDMMRDIGSNTGEGTDIGTLEDFILELAIDNTGADAALLMNVEDGMLVLNKILGYFPPPMALPPMVGSKREYVLEWFSSHRIAAGEGILGQVLAGKEPRLVRDNSERELADNADPESDLYINSAIFVPLIISGSVVSIMALCLTRQDVVFTDLDYAYMRSYGEFVAVTLDNIFKYHELVRSHQLNREIEVAADIQKTLLPERMPAIFQAEVAAFSDAAKGVSGDYYDVFDLGENKTAIVICDVAGKGVPASLLMIMIRTILRTISSPEKRADTIMTELNRAISGRLGADRFATIALIIFDTREHVISYSNGAHHPLYILRGESGRYRVFDTDGLPLGIDINAAFGHKNIRVHSNDYVVMFTDGLPEARNPEGQELGTDRLLRFIARHADQNPREMARRVKDYVEDFTTGNKHDDQTFVALKVG